MIFAGSTGDPIYDLLINGTPYAILVAIVFGFWSGRIVPGGQVDKMEERHTAEVAQLREERDRFAKFVETSAEITQRALDVTEKVKG